MRFGSKVLFENVTTTFSKGRRYGLSGPNGSGKSTFMKLLTGETQAQNGTVTRPDKLGVLRQDQFAFDLESINALNVALQKYEGTVLLVTHDQDLLEEVGTHVWRFDDGSILDFKGPWEELAASAAVS